jgi:D-alanine-D-alanine ligase-like ATP-grasp enzyme
MRKNTARYFESGLKYLLPVFDTPDIDGFTLQLGKNRYYFRDKITPFNDWASSSIADNKYSTNKLLEMAGFPVPKATAISFAQFEQGLLEEIIVGMKFPLVAKPTSDTAFGQDVLCNIKDISQLETYLKKYGPNYDFITIEEFHGNLNSYRILVFNYQVIGVVQRFPAQITGDGEHTIQELIKLENLRRPHEHEVLAPIRVDVECKIRLNELGLVLEDIPAQGEKITLAYTCNSTRGGSFISLGNKIGRANRRLMSRAARLLNLKLVGFDVVCTDINISMLKSAGVFIEANSKPSIRIHEEATQGLPLNVSLTIMRSFIYRHPVLYLLSLFENKRSRVYARALLIVLLGFCFALVGINFA